MFITVFVLVLKETTSDLEHKTFVETKFEKNEEEIKRLYFIAREEKCFL